MGRPSLKDVQGGVDPGLQIATSKRSSRVKFDNVKCLEVKESTNVAFGVVVETKYTLSNLSPVGSRNGCFW